MKCFILNVTLNSLLATQTLNPITVNPNRTQKSILFLINLWQKMRYESKVSLFSLRLGKSNLEISMRWLTTMLNVTPIPHAILILNPNQSQQFTLSKIQIWQ